MQDLAPKSCGQDTMALCLPFRVSAIALDQLDQGRISYLTAWPEGIENDLSEMKFFIEFYRFGQLASAKRFCS